MADALQCYFLDGARNQQGPVDAAEIARLIRNGTIRRDTLVWYAGLPEWRAAGEASEFASLFAQAGPPRPPAAPSSPQPPRFPDAAPQRMAPTAAIDADAPVDGLIVHLGVWGLFWRSFLAVVGGFVVIPAPWTSTTLYRYYAENTWLPDGRRLTFAGKPGDIWYVFIGIAALGVVGQFHNLVVITLPLTYCLNWLVFRWLCDKVGSEDGSVKLAFVGSFWGYVGWNLLIILSVVTIIGWAWVLKFFLRWACRNVRGTVQFDFVATGWGILGRTVLLILACGLLIPIPWVLRWYSAWILSEVRVGTLADHFD
jgi:hypothetical protein